eukprot:1792229-Amphidinium_carterae.1
MDSVNKEFNRKGSCNNGEPDNDMISESACHSAAGRTCSPSDMVNECLAWLGVVPAHVRTAVKVADGMSQNEKPYH